MAKYEKSGKGNAIDVIEYLHKQVMNKSYTVSFEEEGYKRIDNVIVYTKVYERYAYFGKNRSSLSLTVMGNNEDVYVCAIASGGSSAMLFKINTWSEQSFLNTIIDDINYIVK